LRSRNAGPLLELFAAGYGVQISAEGSRRKSVPTNLINEMKEPSVFCRKAMHWKEVPG
jgi:hypothetical protein